MTDVEEPQLTTLAERIAALNKQKNFHARPPGAGTRPPPPPPVNRHAAQSQTAVKTTHVDAASSQPSPALPPRASTVVAERAPALPRRVTVPQQEVAKVAPPDTLPPPLPGRSSQEKTSPGLRARRPSKQQLSDRRSSNSSDVSYLSTMSALSLTRTPSSTTSTGTETQSPRKLPPALDKAKLPPLPPTRRELEAKAKEEKEAAEAVVRSSVHHANSAPIVPRIIDPPRPSLPPRLPSRPTRSPAPEREELGPPLPTRRLPPPASDHHVKSALQSGFNSRAQSATPPPVPLASRPTFSDIEAASARPAIPSRSVSAPAGPVCLVCRDFSGPDRVAAQYPTSSLPRDDTIGYLAHVLCDPFPSATDKARAIFTWCHHNIKYDVEGFFAGCIPRGQTPSEMIFSGKAVCEGYAKVFEAVASRAGLECVVVGGHGKGFGFTPVTEGQPPPPRDASGHAWNSVRIDGGEWKLLDACWGAGALCNGKYNQRFAPEMFYLPNEILGLRHFPSDNRHFYRSDGRIPTWEEYIVGPVQGESAQWYSDASAEGLSEFNFAPRAKKIQVYSGEVVRFQFAKVCEHWQPDKNGRGPQMLFLLKIHGVDGRKDDMIPLESDGFWYYTDVPSRDLGAPGQKIQLLGLQTLGEGSARGVTKEEYLRKKGRYGMSWVYIAAWDLV